MTRKQVNDT